MELTEEERKDLQQERDKIGDFGDPQFEKAYEQLEKEIAKSRGTNARGNVR